MCALRERMHAVYLVLSDSLGRILTTSSNTVIQRQRIYQADPRPVYQRLPRSGLYFGIFQIIFWTGMAGISVGTYNMIAVCTSPWDQLC